MLALPAHFNVGPASSFDTDDRTVNTICHILKHRDEINIADQFPQLCSPWNGTSIGRIHGRPFGNSRFRQPTISALSNSFETSMLSISISRQSTTIVGALPPRQHWQKANDLLEKNDTSSKISRRRNTRYHGSSPRVCIHF